MTCESCSDEAMPGEKYCRWCMEEADTDPDWQWDARHEW